MEEFNKWLFKELNGWRLALSFWEFRSHPLFGFLTAFLASWLIVEDFYDRLIDIRIAGLLMLVVLAWNLLKDFNHFFQAATTMVGFIACFFIFRAFFARFVPLAEYALSQEKEDDTPFDYLDELQEGNSTALMPMMGLATFLVLSADMVMNPMQIVESLARNGIAWAAVAWNTHLSVLQLGINLGDNKALLAGALIMLAVIPLIQFWRARQLALKDKMIPLYPCGAGDPIVLGIFAGMMGAECFYFGVMILTMLLGIMSHAYKSYKGRRSL